ncbi:MAG TPA: hypothetical protein VGL08_01745 [Paraburkholderia sp.]
MPVLQRNRTVDADDMVQLKRVVIDIVNGRTGGDQVASAFTRRSQCGGVRNGQPVPPNTHTRNAAMRIAFDGDGAPQAFVVPERAGMRPAVKQLEQRA